MMRLQLAFLAVTAFAASATAQTFEPLAPLPAIERVDATPKGAKTAELGNMLFFDPRLSGDSSTSCADCHSAADGWADGTDLARGYPSTQHWRNTQSIVNSAYKSGGFHRDGGLTSLSHQVHEAFGTGFVSNLSATIAEERIRQMPVYVELFQEIWGEDPSMDLISEAIATFEQTLISDDSPFDRFAAGDNAALSASERNGFELFNTKANCIACHNGALATDGNAYNTGVPTNPTLSEDPLRLITFRAQIREFGIVDDIANALDRDPGRFIVTGEPTDLGAFRTPPLRYLGYTAPYMHNGVFFDLTEVVEFYNAGGGEDVFGTKSPVLKPLGLTESEVADLVAFLESMTGTWIGATEPVLPEYELSAFPTDSQGVTLASLQSRIDAGEVVKISPDDPKSAPVQVAAVAAAPAPAPQAAQVTDTQQSGSGLTIVSVQNRDDTQTAAAVQQTRQPASSEPSQSSFKPTSTGLSITSTNGQGLTIAAAQPEPTPSVSSGRIEVINGEQFVTVEAGDSLRLLAQQLYGSVNQFQKLYDANRDRISNPNVLILGSRLRVPE